MKYKVGDVVIVKSLDDLKRDFPDKFNTVTHDDVRVNLKPCTFDIGMEQYCREIATITWVGGKTYTIDLDRAKYAWTDDMLERIGLELGL